MFYTVCVNHITISNLIEEIYTSISLEMTCYILIYQCLTFLVRWRVLSNTRCPDKVVNSKKKFVWTPCIKVLTKIVFVCFQGRRRFYQRRRETASYQRPPAQSMAAVWISRKFTACANRSHYLRFVLYVQHNLNDTGSPPLARIPLALFPLAPKLSLSCFIFWFQHLGYMLKW